MIVFDTETTGFVQPELAGLAAQPSIIEIAAIAYDDTAYATSREMHEWERFTSFVNPGMPLDPKVTKITGITDAMLANAPSFFQIVESLANLFTGERIVWAHNAMFDLTVLRHELERIEMQYRFPWPYHQYCTVERTSHLGLKDRKLTTLYEHLLKKPYPQTHRALDDVLALAEIIGALP